MIILICLNSLTLKDLALVDICCHCSLWLSVIRTAIVYLQWLSPLIFGNCQWHPLLKRGCVGFLCYYRSHARLCAGFTVFSNQRTSARASYYSVTKQTGLSKCSSQPPSKDEKQLRCFLSICFTYVDPFTDLNWAILIVTSSLQACWLSSNALKCGSWSWGLTFTVSRSPAQTRSD